MMVYLLSCIIVRIMKIKIFLSAKVFKWTPSLLNSNVSIVRRTITFKRGTIIKNPILQ